MRGFSGGLANKTLVLIDGRAVYDPLFGGTLWDVQDVVLADVDRIEVIRGPGATLWGANAVNGVVNIITKSSADTQGSYAKAGGGNVEEGFATARYGGKVGKATYRVFGKYFDRDHFTTVTGEPAHDAWDFGHGGFRVDIPGDARTNYTVQGDIYNAGEIGETLRIPIANQHLQFQQQTDTGWANGGNLLLRASHATSADSGFSLQLYYDRTSRTQGGGFHVERDTGDFDFRHHFQLGKRDEIQWGVGERYSADRSRSSAVLALTPESRDLNTVSGFVQNTITLLPDRVFAMLGTKLENNSFTGFEVQPSGRLWWTPDDRDTLWASISRPVRVPTRIEQDGFITLGIVDTGLAGGGAASGVFAPIGLAGNPSADSEKLIAYEVGYRRMLTENLSVDIAPFYNDYTRLLFVPRTILGTFTNAGSGESYGVEVSSMLRAFDRWSLEGSYTYVDVEIHGDLAPTDQGDSPHHQVKVLSFLNVTDDIELNTGLYYVDKVQTQQVPYYVRLDQGLTWHATPHIDFSLWGQDLLQHTHRETSMTERVERAVYAEVDFHF
jgi:iron complex outermembrane receptor protein